MNEYFSCENLVKKHIILNKEIYTHITIHKEKNMHTVFAFRIIDLVEAGVCIPGLFRQYREYAHKLSECFGVSFTTRTIDTLTL